MFFSWTVYRMPTIFRVSLAALLLSSLTIAGCATSPAPSGTPQPSAPVSATAPSSESQKLQALFDEYFGETLKLNPILATSIGDTRYNDRFVVGIAPAVIEQ